MLRESCTAARKVIHFYEDSIPFAIREQITSLVVYAMPLCNHTPLEPTTLSELNTVPVEQLGLVDIGRANLLCAEKLVGSEDLDLTEALRQIDQMAAVVANATRCNWDRFQRDPEQFGGSEVQFCMLVLVTILQRDFGVTYDVEWFENPPDFTDSRHFFIHGLLAGHGGTCSSLPVLYAAVGRRLGYPLKLVSSVSHLFLRWDDPIAGERFNIETTAHGFVSHIDEHYKSWPKPMQPEDLRGRYYLTSYSSQQELACFYYTRAQYYFDWLKFGHAMRLAHRACELFPGEPNFRGQHTLATLLYFENSGIEKCSTSQGIVLQNSKRKPIEPWEQWAVGQAQRELERLRSIHEAKKKAATTNATEAAFAALNA